MTTTVQGIAWPKQADFTLRKSGKVDVLEIHFSKPLPKDWDVKGLKVTVTRKEKS